MGAVGLGFMHNGGRRISIAKLKAIQMREDSDRIRQRKIFKERQEALKRATLSDLSDNCREALRTEDQNSLPEKQKGDLFDQLVINELEIDELDIDAEYHVQPQKRKPTLRQQNELKAKREFAFQDSAKRHRDRTFKRELEAYAASHQPSTWSRMSNTEKQRTIWIVSIVLFSVIFLVLDAATKPEYSGPPIKTRAERSREFEQDMDRLKRHRQEQYDQEIIRHLREGWIDERTRPNR